jgi:hypothetical protein
MTLSLFYQDFTSYKTKGADAIIAEDDRAKLMYYLGTVKYVIGDKKEISSWMTENENYKSIDPLRFHEIVKMCQIFSPQKMLRSFRFILVDPAQLNESANQFYRLPDNSGLITAADENWFLRNYYIPLEKIIKKLSKSIEIEKRAFQRQSLNFHQIYLFLNVKRIIEKVEKKKLII